MISKKVFLSYKNHDGNQVGEKVVLTENDFLVFISRAVLYPSEKKSIGPGLGDKIKEAIVKCYGYVAEKGEGSSDEQKTQIQKFRKNLIDFRNSINHGDDETAREELKKVLSVTNFSMENHVIDKIIKPLGGIVETLNLLCFHSQFILNALPDDLNTSSGIFLKKPDWISDLTYWNEGGAQGDMLAQAVAEPIFN